MIKFQLFNYLITKIKANRPLFHNQQINQVDLQMESSRMKELKCFSKFGQIFIVSLLCFMTVLPCFISLFIPYMLYFFDEFVCTAICNAYLCAIHIIDISLFLLYAISLCVLSYCNYKIQELSLYLALVLFVLCAFVICMPVDLILYTYVNY
jgi:hypothetical protein